jgi:23S rRNA pseudouridine1911/1915/1917 synthase
MKNLEDFFQIIFQNNNFLVINKQNQLSTQHNKDYEISVESYLKEVGDPFISLPRCGIVHRLDKDTTGLLLIAKNLQYFDFLSELFKERKIEKNYLSLHEGIPETNRGEISFFLKKKFVKNKPVKMEINSSEGKFVKLYFELVKTCNGFSLIKVNPVTGRTHQIRLAFQAINFPIYNDPLYGNNQYNDNNEYGQYLHASSLKFSDNDNNFEFSAELPSFFQKKLEKLVK